MLLRWSLQFAIDSLRGLLKNQSVRWNHYNALGLTPSATFSEIKAAYYKLSKIHHPDRNNGSQASAKKFRDIVAAYEILSKEESRRKYDREITKNYEIRTTDFEFRKRVNKRVKKTSSLHKVKPSQFKNESYGKSKHKSNKEFAKISRKNNPEDFDTFMIKTIPLVMACFMSHKKR